MARETARDGTVRKEVVREEGVQEEVVRENSVREDDAERSLLDRRSYLKLAGAAAATVAVTSVEGSADAGHDTITVPADETEAIENPQVEQDKRTDNPDVSATNTRLDSEVDTDKMPDGVPTTPEEAVPESVSD